MKFKLPRQLVFSGVLLAGLLALFAFLFTPPSVEAWDIKIDKRMEAEFKTASGKRYCQSIPYTDLREDCPDLSAEVTTYCKSTSMTCVYFRGELDRAKKAKDKKRIEEIRVECLHRRQVAHDCVTARANVMAIFARAASRLEADKKIFEKALDDAQAEMRSKTRKRPMAELDAEIEYCGKMIGYSNTILAHFAEEAAKHERPLQEYKDVVTDCDRFSHNFK